MVQRVFHLRLFVKCLRPELPRSPAETVHRIIIVPVTVAIQPHVCHCVGVSGAPASDVQGVRVTGLQVVLAGVTISELILHS